MARRKRRNGRTLEERREKHATRLRDHSALAPNTDRSSNVVSSDHPRRNVCAAECRDRRRRSGLELVLEDDETEEAEIRLDELPVDVATELAKVLLVYGERITRLFNL